MNKIHAVLAITLTALCAGAFAQESDTARQERMDEAYANSHRDTRTVGESVRDDTHRAGHAIHNGVRETGHAVHRGVRATGHAIHQGVRATGHAIHRGVDKITGK
jgi:Ni/Co efflux regulator RcnB